MAACKRLFRLGAINSGISLSKLGSLNASAVKSHVDKIRLESSSSRWTSHLGFQRFDCRQISQLVKPGQRVFLVDTLALVRKLESQGVHSKQAEAITEAIIEVLNDSLENVAHSFVSKAEMQKSEMAQESNLSQFKSKVQSSQVLVELYIL